ncbi:MAG TPA: hypothetical protein VGC95_08160 [Chitinophagaceae bacterium]
MELDDLKNIWKESPVKTTKPTNIMDLIQHARYGPLAALKKTYRKQIVAMSALPVFLIVANMEDIHKVLTSILFWSYIAFCIGVVVFASYNYRVVRRMQTLDTEVNANLSTQIGWLERRMNLEIWGLRGALLFFIALVEIVPHFQHYRMLDKWHFLPLTARLGAYVALMLLQYFVNARLKERRVGRHLEYLKSLLGQMQ